MKRKFYFIVSTAILLASSTVSLRAQYLNPADSAFNAGSPMTGHLWGYAFADYYVKGHSDALFRGGSNQYSGIPQKRNAFQIRRIYLGYDFNFSKKFSAELLLAVEDNFPTGNPPMSASASGDELLDSKLAFYIKLANIRWKNLWKGTDVIVGQQATPAFSISEKVWGYRSIERTITDIRRTPSYDLGIGLQGTFDPKTKNFGYDLLAANGSSAKPASVSFKWFYGDVWAKFFKQRFIIDFYADYNESNWTSNWHHSRQMLKLFIGYNTPQIAIGVEGFINNLKQDVFATRMSDSGLDTLNNMASGISAFVTGDIIKEKLRFFVRYDHYMPTNKVNNDLYSGYKLNTGNYNDNSYSSVASANAAAVATGDETYQQDFVTAGLDYTPVKNVHIMPNIWYNHYSTQLSNNLNNATNGTLANKAKGDYDLVYRITFYYTFGK